MVQGEVFEVKFPDGKIQKGARFLSLNPKKNLLGIVGMNEHFGRWLPFAEAMVSYGINFYILDPIGQGLNVVEGHREMYVPVGGFRQNVDALKIQLDILTKELPTSLFGHSAGSFALQYFAETYPKSAEHIILCGTDYPGPEYVLAHSLTKAIVNEKNAAEPDLFADWAGNILFGRRVKGKKDKYSWVTTDEKMVKEAYLDPHSHFPPTYSLLREIAWGMKEIRLNYKNISPDESVLIIYGKEDPIGNYGYGPEKLYRALKKFGFDDVHIKEYEGMRHEIIIDIGKEKVFKDIAEFVLS